MGARTGRSRLRQAFLALARRFCNRVVKKTGIGLQSPTPGRHGTSAGGHGPPLASLCVLARLSPRLTTNTVQEGRNAVTAGGLSFAGTSSRESGLPVSDREALFSHLGNGPVFVVYSRSVGDGGQRLCTQSASPVRRASCSGSIVRPQALQFCLGVGKVIFNRQPVTFVAAGCASDLVPMRSSLAEA
jgi:hypothetical protein